MLDCRFRGRARSYSRHPFRQPSRLRPGLRNSRPTPASPKVITMPNRRRYRRKPDQAVAAVQINLDTPGFEYRKWGDDQRCKRGDWLVDNDGEVYTVEEAVFARTYRKVGTGAYVKSTPIWAEAAAEAGSIGTKEGRTHYERGDYVVSNDEDGSDAYAIAAAKFESMYELDE